MFRTIAGFIYRQFYLSIEFLFIEYTFTIFCLKSCETYDEVFQTYINVCPTQPWGFVMLEIAVYCYVALLGFL